MKWKCEEKRGQLCDHGYCERYKDADHHGLSGICIDIDSTSGTPMLAGCKVLTVEDVSKALEVMEMDPHCEDNVAKH